jgi:hypothetical protein
MSAPIQGIPSAGINMDGNSQEEGKVVSPEYKVPSLT